MSRMLMLSGAMVLALAASGTARAESQILDCYGANGRVVACAADYPDIKPAPRTHTTQMRSTAPTEEEIVVVGVRPDWDTIPTYSHPGTRLDRPGVGGDWMPAAATSAEDKLQQWQATFLGGEGLSGGLRF